MSRSLDGLLKIKSEIINDPLVLGYSGKDSAAQQALFAAPTSQSPQVFVTVTPVAKQVIANFFFTNATNAQVSAIQTYLVNNGYLPASAFASSQVEVKPRRCDVLELGDVMASEIDIAKTI